MTAMIATAGEITARRWPFWHSLWGISTCLFINDKSRWSVVSSWLSVAHAIFTHLILSTWRSEPDNHGWIHLGRCVHCFGSEVMALSWSGGSMVLSACSMF